MFNRPRITNTRGGGVSILLKEKYKSVLLRKRTFYSFESLSILTNLSGMPSQKLKIVSLYRRESVVFSTFIKEFSGYLQNLSLSKYSFVVAGDFNIHMNNLDHSYTKRFTKLCREHNLCLENIPDSQTHKAGNTIDFLVCDDIANSLIIECLVDLHAPNISDHFPVLYKMKASLALRRQEIQKPRRSFRNFSLANMKTGLKESLAELPSCSTFMEKVEKFQISLKTNYDRHLPLKTTPITYYERPH